MWFSFEIEGHPPSTNRIARFGRGGFYKPPQYLAWELVVKRSVLASPFTHRFDKVAYRPFKLEIMFVSKSWYQKNGKGIRKPDLSNLIKATEDAICKVTGWDDKNALEITVKKVESDAPDHTVVTFQFL